MSQSTHLLRKPDHRVGGTTKTGPGGACVASGAEMDPGISRGESEVTRALSRLVESGLPPCLQEGTPGDGSLDVSFARNPDAPEEVAQVDRGGE